MTREQYNDIVTNFPLYKGQQVEYKYFIPSANRYSTSKGVIEAIGEKCNKDCIIIGDRNRKYAIYYKYVII